jgi:hypothetical protein
MTTAKLVTALFILATFLYASSESKKKPTINTTHWIPVSISFRPFDLTATNGAFWLCGLNETIAVSQDDGRTWRVRHQNHDGEVLTKIEFVNEKVGHAAGTGGLLLTTTDGGQTWVGTRGVNDTIDDVSFVDAKTGIAQISDHVSLTSDGGDHWRLVEAMRDDPKVRPFSEIESVAALSLTRFAIALHQDQGENIVLSTDDAGKRWIPTHISNTFADTLVPHAGEFWAFGIEYLGREHNPYGGYSAPVTLHSPDGRNWEHGTRASNEVSGCNAQGCELSYGVIESLYEKAPRIWSAPQDSPVSGKWALVRDTVCTIAAGIKCGKALLSDAPQPMPDRDGPIEIAIDPSAPLVEGCLECRFSQVPAPHAVGPRGALIKGITARFMVNRDGSVRDVTVMGNIGSETSDAISSQVAQWIIAPTHKGFATVSRQEQLELVLLCQPSIPGWLGGGCTVALPRDLTPKH